MNWARHSPPDTGGVAAPSRKRCEATAAAQTGWSGLPKCFKMHSLKEVPLSTTPAAPLKEASRLLLDVASTPPMSGGEWHHPKFIHSFQNRAYKHWQQHPDGRTLYKRCQTSRECPATAPSRTLR